MNVTLEVRGANELVNKLRTIPIEMQREIMRDAMKEGADLIADDARARAPKSRGGNSPESIVSRIRTTVKVDENASEVQAKVRADAPHSHLMEGGVKPHEIEAGKGVRRGLRGIQSLAKMAGLNVTVVGQPAKILTDGKKFFGKKVKHPGVSPRPFMQPAFEAKASNAVQLIMQHIRAGLEALAAKQ